MTLLAIERAHSLRWLSEAALPLWTTRGFDAELGLFHERLDFSGAPRPGLPRRLMVQCRQIYVLCHASLRGLFEGRTLIERAWTQTQRHFYRPELAHKWVFSIHPNGEIADERCDTYTLAFVLHTLAWLYRLDPRPDLLEKADELLRLIDDRLTASNGGVTCGIPRPDALLRQNPNMHLFEACLALYEVTGRADLLDRAHVLRRLFAERMLDRDAQALPEWHGEGWRRDLGDGNWYEPGHHFEWVWLLRQHEALSGHPAGDDVETLLARALPEGVDAQGLAIERIALPTGEPQRSRRLWGTCEYLKACAAEAAAGSADSPAWRERAALALQGLQRHFLATVTPGLWCDRIDAAGSALSEDVPASSLYHVSLALLECERVFGTVRTAPRAERSIARPALFLDRDGVINVDTGYPLKPEQITFIPGAADAIRLARSQGFQIIVVTNQSGVARGMGTEDDVMQLHRWMSRELLAAGAEVDAWYHCPFHEPAQNPAYRWDDHPDRKPNPGMLHRAALDFHIDLPGSILIGDRPSDLQAAQRAGVAGHLFNGGNLREFVAQLLNPTRS